MPTIPNGPKRPAAADGCGCKTGAAAAAIALSLYIAAFGAIPWLLGRPIGMTWTGGLLIFLGSAVVGKVAGLRLAGRRPQVSIE